MPKKKKETIQLRGVRQHNLKGFDLDLPIGQLTAVTGLSGAGKSSLVFKTLHAEGQRRYVETFSPYTRQFMELLDRPAVDRIENIRPSIAIQQSNTVKTSRSTVGTITELCDYFKVWFANQATLFDPADGSPVRDDNPQTIWKTVFESYQTVSILLCFRVEKPDNLPWADILKSLSGQGYTRVLDFDEKAKQGNMLRIDDLLQKKSPLPEPARKKGTKKRSLFVIQDRIKVDQSNRARFIEAAQQALHFGGGHVHLFDPEGTPLAAYSEGLNSAQTGQVFRPAIPALFSFNSPIGACPTCRGFGRVIEIDDRLVIPDHSLSIDDGAIRAFQGEVYSSSLRNLQRAARRHGIRTNVPYGEMTEAEQRFVQEGEPGYEEGNYDSQWYGVRHFFEWLESKVYRMHVRVFLSKFRSYRTCPDCNGARLQPEALYWKWRGHTLPDLYQKSVDELLLLLSPEADAYPSKLPGAEDEQQGTNNGEPRSDNQKPTTNKQPTTNNKQQPTNNKQLPTPRDTALEGILHRLGFLTDVGLGYLSLDRSSRSLSGGETMRVNLTSCLGSALTDTLFVLDEPSVGLHARDMDRLIAILRRLTSLGNTVVVVEHDEAIMQAADHLIEIGPKPGTQGGHLTFQGSLAQLLRSNTITGRYLSGREDVDIPEQRRGSVIEESAPDAQNLTSNVQRSTSNVQRSTFNVQRSTFNVRRPPLLSIYGAEKHNIRGLDLHLPQQRLVCLSGVSGSGKSTLLNNVIYQNLLVEKGQAADDPAAIQDIESTLPLSEIVLVDQSPVSKTPRSNPALFTKAWDEIRKLFARLDAARSAGMLAGHFSFNGGDGRCPSCSGLGYERIEMQFVSDVFVPCETCEGRRFKDEVLAIEFNGKSIADILELDVDEAVLFFGEYKKIVRALQPLVDVGLGYLKLGQPLNTLSGGESQRLKLVRHLGRVTTRSKADSQPATTKTQQQTTSNQQRATSNQQRATSNQQPTTNNEQPTTTNHTPHSGAPHALILIDEPTTGLHRDDVKRLLRVLQKLVDAGHSLLVIEHNLDVLKSADWIVEMGPQAGAGGGRIVAEGTPEQIAETDCETAPYLREALGERQTSDVERRTPDEASLVAAEAQSTYNPQPATSNQQPTTSNQQPATPSRKKNSAFDVQQSAFDVRRSMFDVRRSLQIVGAREHNLNDVSAEIPHRKMTVVTGVSGSGKSTLAFDVAFAEGQRRFMESMSAYARQFVEQMPRAEVDALHGIAPTVAIEQRVTKGTRKSTVATITEVAQYLRLLYARIGVQHSPTTGDAVVSQSEAALFKRLQSLLATAQNQQLATNNQQQTTTLYLCTPLIRGRKGHHEPVANWARDHGYDLLRIDGKLIPLDRFEKLDRYREHDIDLVVEQLHPTLSKTAKRPRSTASTNQALRTALNLGKGTAFLLSPSGEILSWLSTTRTDPTTGEAFPELDPKHFSWNSPRGWCPNCRGYGRLFDWMRDEDDEGPLKDHLDPSNARSSDTVDHGEICPDCHGTRLNPISRAVRLPLKKKKPTENSTFNVQHSTSNTPSSVSLPELLQLTPSELIATLRAVKTTARSKPILAELLPEIEERMRFMDRVGLGYLQLDRATATLSGGEAQRIRLAAQLGSNLSGVLYVLDEPSIGLHARDNEKLLQSLEQLRNRGNTLIVVEHNETTMRHADRIIDLGPGAGIHGGEIVVSGTLAQVKKNKTSLTGKYLRQSIPHPTRGSYRELPPAWSPRKKKGMDEWIALRGAALRNLKGFDLAIPKNRLTVVCGVSGAGKSTLVRDLLHPLVRKAIEDRDNDLIAGDSPSSISHHSFRALKGAAGIRKVIEVDHSPIGKTTRSTPATYIGAFDTIREIFASLPEANMRGYTASSFSFNTKGGRCESCKGAGRIKLEMNFMPDTYVTCEDCGGRRYSSELEELRWHGKSIADVLQMSFEEAAEFFSFHTQLSQLMQLMVDTGLGYITLGQYSPTLSGGEAQRMKLVSELAKGQPSFKERQYNKGQGNLYILEEPTIGLHLADVERLTELLHRLVDKGHTVIVIEHHLEIIRDADYIVEIGPEGGDAGGHLLYQGNLAGLRAAGGSPTAQFL